MTLYIIDKSHPIETATAIDTPALSLKRGDGVGLIEGSITAMGEGSRSSAIIGDGDNNIILDGRVHSEHSDGIRAILGYIGVTAHGTVYGGLSGIENHGYGLGQVNNSGWIIGERLGINLSCVDNVISNEGLIQGWDAISVGGRSSGPDKPNSLTVHNLPGGTITSMQALMLDNGIAIRGASFGKNYIQNQGQIIGDIYLGNGDDTYIGSGGTIDGVILTGAGNDIVWGGSGSETIALGTGVDFVDGGAGNDTLALDSVPYGGVRKIDLRMTEQ